MRPVFRSLKTPRTPFRRSTKAARSGSIGKATCFSFYATKSITTGEGGMITTDDDDLAERCRIMSLHGISKDAWKRYMLEGSWFYEIIAPGYKYNMTDIAAAMGLVQLRKAERMRARRAEIASAYNKPFREFLNSRCRPTGLTVYTPGISICCGSTLTASPSIGQNSSKS